MNGAEFLRQHYNVPPEYTLRKYFEGELWTVDDIVKLLDDFAEMMPYAVSHETIKPEKPLGPSIIND